MEIYLSDATKLKFDQIKESKKELSNSAVIEELIIDESKNLVLKAYGLGIAIGCILSVILNACTKL